MNGEWTSPERVERKSVWGCLRAVGFRFETGRSGDARMKVAFTSLHWAIYYDSVE